MCADGIVGCEFVHSHSKFQSERTGKVITVHMCRNASHLSHTCPIMQITSTAIPELNRELDNCHCTSLAKSRNPKRARIDTRFQLITDLHRASARAPEKPACCGDYCCTVQSAHCGHLQQHSARIEPVCLLCINLSARTLERNLHLCEQQQRQRAPVFAAGSYCGKRLGSTTAAAT